MKKILIIIIAAMLMLSACGQSAESETTVTQTPTQEIDLGYVMDGDDVHVTKDGTTLKDMTITGDLYIDESVGEGDVTIENVTVEGTTYVLGGGKNSVHFFSYYGYTTIVRSPFDTRMTVNDVSSLGDVFFEAGGTIEHYGPNDYSPAYSVNIGGENTSDTIDVNLKGNYDNVNVNSDANVNVDGTVDDMYVAPDAYANVDVADGGRINDVDSYGKVDVNGAEGSVGSATMGSGGGSMPDGLEKIGSHEEGAQVNVGGEEHTLPKTTEGEYDQAIDGGFSCEGYLTGIYNMAVDVKGVKADNTITIERIRVGKSKVPSTVYYAAVPSGGAVPSKKQLMGGGFGRKSGSLQYSEGNYSQDLILSGIDVKKTTKYTVYFLVVDKDGKEMRMSKRNVYVNPPEGQEYEDEDENADDNSGSGSGNSGSSSETEAGGLAEGYPKVLIGAQSVTVTAMAYETCKVYFLVEAPDIFALGTTPQNVKNGVSKGAGTTMGDGGKYIVFHGVINVSTALKEYSERVVISDTDNTGGDGPPNGEANTPGVFLVIEYADGSLSQVYTYR